MSTTPASQKSRFSSVKKSKRKWLIALIFGLYLTFILTSWLPNLAQQTVMEQMDENVYRYLTFTHDGWNEHYYVERYNANTDGHIELTYTTSSNTLEVECENLKVLWIDSRSLYEDEAERVLKVDPFEDTNYYKKYFIERNRFNVFVVTSESIEELKFLDAPVAYNVSVNGEEWWLTHTLYNYTHDGVMLSHVPRGQTNVVMFFSDDGNPSNPVASFTSSHDEAMVDQMVAFDASTSHDDGSIITYEWDFGDGTFSIGMKASHVYQKPGNYGIILTVTDNEYLVARAYQPINISSGTPGGINGIISDIIVPEDSPPFSLDLSPYEPKKVGDDSEVDFVWYLTGEDRWLYRVTGENESTSTLQFTLEPNAFGAESFDLYMTDGVSQLYTQKVNITVTPVNDKPYFISQIPDLVIHYDAPYMFDYISYIWDEETPREDLILTTNDPVHTEVSSTQVTYTYPESMLGKTEYIVLTLSDGELFAQDVLSVKVTDDHPPNEAVPLPNILMYEGESLECVFNLNDYFQDMDGDPMYFSYGYTHLNITIQSSGCVDILAPDDWNGEELVTFRATDPYSGLAEQTITVTVLPVNDPPVISGVPDMVVHYDAEYKFDLDPYIWDEDNTTDELRITTSDPVHIRMSSFQNTVMILLYPIDVMSDDYNIPVKITVSDGIDESFQTIMVEVTTNWPPIQTNPLPDVFFAEDTVARDVFNLRAHFSDPDLEGIFFSYSQLNIRAEVHEDGMVDISAPQDWYGMEEVTFRAIDQGGAIAEDTIVVTVTPVNDPPMFSQLPTQEAEVGDVWILDLRPYINDVDTPIQDLNVVLLDEFEDIWVNGTDVIFLGARPMKNTVTLRVSDGELTSEGSLLVVVTGEEDTIPTFWDFFSMYWYLFMVLMVIGILFIASYIRRQNNFEILEAFLVYKNGLLISHVERGEGKKGQGRDQEAVSALLTAIQDFVSDSFSSPGEEKKALSLREINFGEHKIFLEKQENITLAVLFNGVSSRKMVRRVKKVLDGIVKFYPEASKGWRGDIDDFGGVKQHLKKVLTPESVFDNKTADRTRDQKMPTPTAVPARINVTPLAQPSVSWKMARPTPVNLTPSPVPQPIKAPTVVRSVPSSYGTPTPRAVPTPVKSFLPTPRAVPTPRHF